MTDATEPICCTPKALPAHQAGEGMAQAVLVNPVNAPPAAGLAMVTALVGAAPLRPGRLALLVSRYWGAGGVRLTVGFMDAPNAATRRLILAHANAWGETANVKFTESRRSPQVRVSRHEGGYWSYLGTDVLLIPPDQPTMCLQGFTERTPESEYRRVVRHEFGHTLGFPHEHLRRELVGRLDPAKTVEYFGRTQGWSEEEVRAQVLTPLEESAVVGTPGADELSCMTYSLPGEITRDGRPIVGGLDIDASDRAFAARCYPRK